MISDQSSNVLVAVRIRPLSSQEQTLGQRSCCQVIGDRDNANIVAIRKNGDASQYLKSQQLSINEYAYDVVFGDSVDQREVYERTAMPYMSKLINGENVTVFAYGATGAGKTHTMLGNTRQDSASERAEAGIIPNSVQDVFKAIERRKELLRYGESYSLQLSFLEVYNEQVYDLLESSGKVLSIREDQERGIVVVAGITEQSVDSFTQVMDFILQGNRRRKTEATMANAVSSRSHAVLQLTLKHTTRTESGRETCVESKLSLIDLAGSERASATNNRGVRLQEGANINKSLLALANCINSLAEQQANRSSASNLKKVNVKYRDSKLTHLLKSSLEGNCNLIMIANINPSDLTYEDSHNTLKYANRAKNIKVCPIVKETNKDSTWIEREHRLREENMFLKKALEDLQEEVDGLRAFKEMVLKNNGLIPAVELKEKAYSSIEDSADSGKSVVALISNPTPIADLETVQALPAFSEEPVLMNPRKRRASHLPTMVTAASKTNKRRSIAVLPSFNKASSSPFLAKEQTSLVESVAKSSEFDSQYCNAAKTEATETEPALESTCYDAPSLEADEAVTASDVLQTDFEDDIFMNMQNDDFSSFAINEMMMQQISELRDLAAPAVSSASIPMEEDLDASFHTAVDEKEEIASAEEVDKDVCDEIHSLPVQEKPLFDAVVDSDSVLLAERNTENIEFNINLSWLDVTESAPTVSQPLVTAKTNRSSLASSTRRRSMAKVTAMLDNLSKDVSNMQKRGSVQVEAATTPLVASSSSASATLIHSENSENIRITRSMSSTPNETPESTKENSKPMLTRRRSSLLDLQSELGSQPSAGGVSKRMSVGSKLEVMKENIRNTRRESISNRNQGKALTSSFVPANASTMFDI